LSELGSEASDEFDHDVKGITLNLGEPEQQNEVQLINQRLFRPGKLGELVSRIWASAKIVAVTRNTFGKSRVGRFIRRSMARFGSRWSWYD